MKKLYFFAIFVSILLLVSCTKDIGVEPVVVPPVKKFAVEVTAGPNITVNNTKFSVIDGESATIIATLDMGYVLDVVLVDGIVIPITNSNPYTYTFYNVTADHKISITSKKILKFAISVSTSSNITVTYSGPTTELPSGVGLTITFKFLQYYDADTVLVDEVKTSLTNLSYTFSNITANHSIKVTSKINSLGVAFNFLSMPKAFYKDSIYIRALGTTNWYYSKSTSHDSIFFRPDYKFEIFRDGEMIGNDTYSISENPLTINFKGSPHGPWRVLILNEKVLKIITSSINTTDGEDIQFVFTRH